MPRVFSSNNDPLDFCQECFPTEDEAYLQFGDMGGGPDGRGNCFAYDAEHPTYDGEGYCCFECSQPLDESDDFTPTQ